MIIREKITPEIQNAICSCYDKLNGFFLNSGVYYDTPYLDMEKYLWTNFLNQREGNFHEGRTYHIVATLFIEDENNPWYRKLDLVELTIKYLYAMDAKYDRRMYVFRSFVKQLNYEFERLNFAYRVVNTEIVEITSKEELVAVESSMHDSPSNIRMHLNKALELYAQRPIGDYRNSIKESISAIEAYCREITGQKISVDIAMISKIGVYIIHILEHPVTDYGEIQDDIYNKVEAKFKKQYFLRKRKKLLFDFQVITFCEGRMEVLEECLLAKTNEDLMGYIDKYACSEEYSDDLYGKLLS